MIHFIFVWIMSETQPVELPAAPAAFCICLSKASWCKHLISPAEQTQSRLMETSWNISFQLEISGLMIVSPLLGSTKLQSSHPCKCARWPIASAGFQMRAAPVLEGRAQLRLSPVHVWGAPADDDWVTEPFASAPPHSVIFLSAPMEAASFRLPLDWLVRGTCCFPASPACLPCFSLSHKHARFTAHNGSNKNRVDSFSVNQARTVFYYQSH